MGVRKREKANIVKENNKKTFFAMLNNCPTSPRKMRLVADLISGKNVNLALNTLKHTNREAAGRMYKLVLSALANWQAKNEGTRVEEADLFIKEVKVNGGRVLKRIRPAPQGRAHRVRKRSNHITVILDSKILINNNTEIIKS